MSYEVTLALLKPTVLSSQPAIQEIFKCIKAADLDILSTKRLFWHPSEARTFYAEHVGKFYHDRLVAHASSGPSMGLMLGGRDAIARWRQLIGPTKAYKAMWTHPESLRARYGLSDTRNGFHGSDSPASARKELNFVFEGLDIDWIVQRQAASP